MCGRYTLASYLGDLAERFEFEVPTFAYRPRYNIAPSQAVLAVTSSSDRQAKMMRWGLVPFWAKSLSVGYKMINARVETVDTSGAFKHAFRRRRCLVLADGFYEWKKDDGTKTPMRIVLKNREPFAFAGLWETWKSPDEEEVESCTIVTCPPNELMEPIHDRMPVILPEEAEDIWLDGSVDDTDQLKSLLVPYSAEGMEAYQVSTLVNSPKNNDPQCIQPA